MLPKKKYTIDITSTDSPQRIDRLLAAQFPQLSRSFIQKLIHQDLVLVNGKPVKASYRPEAGDKIEIYIPPQQNTEVTPESIPLNIVYEDEHLLVVDKPAGMVVHPGAGVWQGTLVNALLAYCGKLSGVGGRLRPGIVHRLDKNTSGLLVVARNDITHHALQRQFAEKSVKREYRALVWGKLTPEEGILETFVNRSKSDRKKFVVAPSGKPAITHYRVEEYFSFLTLVRIRLETGRTHQIRVHFNYLHHPIFGDPEYSVRNKQINRLSSLSQKKNAVYWLKIMPRQALHAFSLGFLHPMRNEWLEFESPLPNDFKNLMSAIRKYEDEL